MDKCQKPLTQLLKFDDPPLTLRAFFVHASVYVVDIYIRYGKCIKTASVMVVITPTTFVFLSNLYCSGYIYCTTPGNNEPPPPLCNNDHVCLLFQFRFVSQVQWAPTDEKVRSPTATADKGFLCSKGKVRGWTSLSFCHIRNGFHNRRRSSLSALSTTRPTTTGRRSPSTSPSTTTPRSRSRPSG